MARYYHVAGQKYTPGEPLLPWDTLLEDDILNEGDWKWPEADMGYDGDVVSLFETLDEAHEFAATYGGTILAIDVPEGDDFGLYELPWGGYINPRVIRGEEGYWAIEDGIPAEWISEV